MRLYYDFQILLLQQYGGISRYFYEVISRLSYDRVDIHIPVLDNRNYYFAEYFNRPVKHETQRRGIWKLNTINTKFRIANRKNIILHPTYYDPYFLGQYKGKLVVTIHDMAQESFPEFFNDQEVICRKKLHMDAADRIIAVSESTKNDILTFYPEVDEKKITVIYHGRNLAWDHARDQSDSVFEKKYENYERYILYVGQRKGYKNFEAFAGAIMTIMDKDSMLGLICAGGGDFSEMECDLLKKHLHRVCQVNASDEELLWLYRHAACFVFPSKSEGFGLPIIEAFQQRCPVVLSDIAIFHEIAGDAALYFNSSSIEDMVEKLMQAIELSENDKMALCEKGKKRAMYFSWETCAEAHFNVYSDVLEQDHC